MDKFFTQKHCDRCQTTLAGSRTMSWFTEETICHFCSQKEGDIRRSLPEGGAKHEGCGYVPTV
jgi:hypothetical protein